MSAQSLQIYTLDIPNPEWSAVASDQARRINDTISFTDILSFNIRTLSGNGANGANDITGLLYVPDLQENDICRNASEQYVPPNVTRQANLPNPNYQLVGIAPWLSANCSMKYMQAAREDPIRALLFYLPGDSTTMPPDSGDVIWNTPDNGRWKSENGFPVYAIPSHSGEDFMWQSALYSGNLTDVPYGNELSEIYLTTDYVRLFVDIDIGSTSSLPSLWIFLLVVLGILLAIIGLTSLCMHWLQRRRREVLRRRVANGEVDLEALGIKRLTVPQALLDRMPTYTYGTGAPVSQTNDPVDEKMATASEYLAHTVTGDQPSPNLLRNSSYRPSPLSQPTCAICLDDFVPASSETRGTTVRELPCHHIFHPECVDTFLRDSSSLCPMCKKTALPRGYCPKTVTNAMVRRERMIRQLRERVASDPNATHPSQFEDRDLAGNLRDFGIRVSAGISQWRASRGVGSAPVSNSQQMEQLGSEVPPGIASTGAPLVRATSTTSSGIRPAPPPVQPPATAGRREWARRRAEAMLGQRAPEDTESDEADRTTTAWGKAVQSLFPRR